MLAAVWALVMLRGTADTSEAAIAKLLTVRAR